MVDFYIQHQMNLMMVFAGISGFVFLFLSCMKIDEKDKKRSFQQIAIFAMILLLADRLTYLYRGDSSTLGFWMVRVFNFLVYASIILVENGFNDYLFSIARKQKVEKDNVKYLKFSRILAMAGLCLLIISQFTGLYYTFDESNNYSRSDGFIICYVIPLVMTFFQFVFIIKNRKIFRKKILISLFVFVGFPIVAGIAQISFYGASFTSISIALSSITIYFFALFDQNNMLVDAAKNEMAIALEMQERSNALLHQTVEALASAVDAKDAYTHGHSNRVAKYALQIAQMSGMSEKECDDVYLAGLLHDVGKIGIDNDIINKPGKLSTKEYETIKQHPVLGGEILSKILISPSLSVGARYHHERYDGKGYPDGLKGEDIPHIARIISVADAYDAMTSKRSYRDMIPQMYVREELVKGIGAQFDPFYAKLMLQLLDKDEDYKMKENEAEEVLGTDLSYDFNEYKTAATPGIRITDYPVSVKLEYKPTKKGGMPTLLLYDSADARYYLEENSLSEEMDFVEYASMGLDGDVITDFVRKMKLNTTSHENEKKAEDTLTADIQLVKKSDHLLVTVTTKERTDEVIFALYDASRYLYMSMTGEYCKVDIVELSVAKAPVDDEYVPRIAEKISYIDKQPVGDIPNIQVDSWRACNSEVIEINGHTEISFHTMSLPASRRVWHCPIICLFTSDDGKINGNNYREILAVRLDGESWCENKEIQNTTSASVDESFDNWSIWKQKNKAGIDCKLVLSHQGDIVDLQVENGGLTTVNQTKLPERAEKVYCYFTGDQCAITDIHIKKDEG